MNRLACMPPPVVPSCRPEILGGSDSPAGRHHRGLPPCHGPSALFPRLVGGGAGCSNPILGRLLQGVGMRSVKNGKLFEDIPARSFCRLVQHALHPVNRDRRVRATSTAPHGSNPKSTSGPQNTCIELFQVHERIPNTCGCFQADDGLSAAAAGLVCSGLKHTNCFRGNISFPGMFRASRL